MPDCSTGAVSIKITSRTRTTSTNGVMLISASAVWVWPVLLVNATNVSWVLIGSECGFFHAVEELPGKVVHAGGEVTATGGVLVVGDDGGDGDHESGSGGDQCFRDARGDCTQRGGAFHAEADKGLHDAHDRSEEADKGRDGADGGEPCEALLHGGERFA